MAIVSSSFTEESPAVEFGRVWVREEHVDSAGIMHTITYLRTTGMDPTAILSAHAIQLAEELAAQEADSWLV